MAELRLAGWKLKAVRKLAENPMTRGALWKAVSADFGLPALMATTSGDRGIVETVPRPVQGRAPRAWEDAGLVAPGGERLQDAYAKGSFTPVDAVDKLFSRLAAKDFGAATHSPFVALDEAGAREAAAASAVRWARGEPLSALDGVPVPIKDEYHQRGLPTRGGTSWRNHVVNEDAFIVTRMREAGAILPGKVHATESGMNPLGYNAHFDYPRNVYSNGHGAGGSSTGSAVAVGLGLAPVAISTDGGGSIRIPASLNGLFGLKPTLQRVSTSGDIWTGTVGHTGPIGKSTADLVDLMEVCAARDPDDPMTHFATDWDTVIPTWRRALGRGVKGCRIGVLVDAMGRADSEIGSLNQAALKALEAEGAILEEVRFPLYDVANAVGALVIAGEGTANAFDDQNAHRDESGEELRLVYGLLKNVTAQQHLFALRVRTRLRFALAELFQRIDLLALPTTGRVAAPYALSENRVELADTAWTSTFTGYNFLGNLTGVPAVSVPVGLSKGLPVGLQLMGDAWDEASVLAAAAHLERIGVSDLPAPQSYAPLQG